MTNIDPMKKSSIYATFGKYYGEKLYKFLYDCCEGAGNFCHTVKNCLGITSNGNPNLVLNQTGEWVENTSTIQTTYTELINLQNNEELISNSYYEFDFRTVHYIQFSGALGSEEIHAGSIERMKVKAFSKSQLSHKLESLDYPTDIIYWKPTFADREWDAVEGQSTGVITSREDPIKKLKRDFDWRNVIFRRWETVPASGIYDSYLNTGYAYQDYPAFNGDINFDIQIGSPLEAYSYTGISPYWLDNTVLGGAVALGKIFLAYGNTFLEEFLNNQIIYASENVIYGDCIDNYFSTFSQNSCQNMKDNRIGIISGNQVSNIYRNIASKLSDNSFVGNINRNIAGGIVSNNSQYPATIEGNSVLEIEENTDFQIISSNSGELILGNTNLNITKNSIGAIVNNTNNAATLKSINNCCGERFEQVETQYDIENTFVNRIYQCTIEGDIKNHNFISPVDAKTITPTADMSSTTPTTSVFDKGDNEHHEQIVTSGLISFSGAITS